MMMVHLYTKGPYLEVIVTNIPQAASKITHSDPQISTKPNNRINIKQRTSYDKGVSSSTQIVTPANFVSKKYFSESRRKSVVIIKFITMT